MPARRVVLSWSSGKDCAWALHSLRRQEDAVLSLLVTVNEAFDRVAMHGVRRSIVEAQAASAGLPLWIVRLPWPCPNEVYEARMAEAVARAEGEGATHVAFGDLFLEEIRAYRERMLAPTRLAPLFPIWTQSTGTAHLAREMIAGGLRAKIVCVDPRKIPERFLGRDFDEQLLKELPPGVDPCGENGEFHTLCWDGPMFSHPLPLAAGARVERDGFGFADFTLADPSTARLAAP
ncbi:MAG: Dph6-related ATP pyrophosphatase [Thermoplasmatota archaeon]